MARKSGGRHDGGHPIIEAPGSGWPAHHWRRHIGNLVLAAALGLGGAPLYAQSTDEPSVVDTWLLPSAQFGISSYFDLVSKLTPEQARAWVLYANMKGYQLGGEKGLENISRAINLLKGGSSVEEIAKRAETVGKIAAALDFLISFANTSEALGGIAGGDYDARGLRDFAWNGLKTSLAALSVAGVSIGTGGLPILISGLVASIDFAINTSDQYKDTGDALDQETLYGSIEQHTQLRIRTGRGRNGGRAFGDPAIKTDERAITMVYNWCLQDANWDRRIMSYVSGQTGKSGDCRDMDPNLVKGQISLLLKDLDRDWRSRETKFVAERNAKVKATVAELQKNLLAVQAELATQPAAERTSDAGAVSGDTLQLDQAYGRYRQTVAALPEMEKYAAGLTEKIRPIRTSVQEYEQTRQGALVTPNQAAISDLTKEINRQAMQLVAIPNDGATESPRKLAVLSSFKNAYTDLIGLAAKLAPSTKPGDAPGKPPSAKEPGKKPDDPPPAGSPGGPGTGTPPGEKPPAGDGPGETPPQPKPAPKPSCKGNTIPLHDNRNEIWKCADDCPSGQNKLIEWDADNEREKLTCGTSAKPGDDTPEPEPVCAEGERLDNVWDEASKSYKNKCIAPKKGDPPGCVYGAPGCSGYKPPDVCIRGAPGCDGYKPPEIDFNAPKERQLSWAEVLAMSPPLRQKFSALYADGKALLNSVESKLRQALALVTKRSSLEKIMDTVCHGEIDMNRLQRDPLATKLVVSNAFGTQGSDLDIIDPPELAAGILALRNQSASAKSALLRMKSTRTQYQATRNIMDGLLADWATYRNRYDGWYKKNQAAIKILNENLPSIVYMTQSQIASGTGPEQLPDLATQRIENLTEMRPGDSCLELEKTMSGIESRLINADGVLKAMNGSYPSLRKSVDALQERMKEMAMYVSAPSGLATASDEVINRLAAAAPGKEGGLLGRDILALAKQIPRNQIKGADGKIRDAADKRIVFAVTDLLQKEPEISRQLANLVAMEIGRRGKRPDGDLKPPQPPGGLPAPPAGASPGHAPSGTPAASPAALPAATQGAPAGAATAVAGRKATAESPVRAGTTDDGFADQPSGMTTLALAKPGQPDQNIVQIRELYQKFVQAYQAKNLSGVVRAMTPQWQASDGSGLADLEDTLRNSFRVFDVIQFRIEGLQIQKGGTDTYNVSYAATLSGRINRLNIKHEETSSVQDVVKLTPDGPRIVKTQGNVTIKAK